MRKTFSSFSIGCVVAAAALATHGEETMKLALTSTAFAEGASIPVQYTCEGKNLSPPLQWQGVPANARSLVLIVDDPDAPDPAAPKLTWVHWVLYNIPVDAAYLSEGVASADLPAGTLWRPLPAHRPASVFSQAVCAGHGAVRTEQAEQGAGGGGDERTCHCQDRTDRNLSEGKVEARRRTWVVN